MHTTKLRKVGGSVMLAVPPAILELLHLKSGATVSVAVEGGRLVVEPQARPRYTMAELLAASDFLTRSRRKSGNGLMRPRQAVKGCEARRYLPGDA